MIRCTLCDTPIENDHMEEPCPECGGDPVTGADPASMALLPFQIVTNPAQTKGRIAHTRSAQAQIRFAG